MVGKLLSLDLEEKGVAIGIVHPGFMRTEMTKGVGFDVYWDDGGGALPFFFDFLDGKAVVGKYNTDGDECVAVMPEVAAKSMVDWIETDFDMSKTGQYWAPRGPRKFPSLPPSIHQSHPPQPKEDPAKRTPNLQTLAYQ